MANSPISIPIQGPPISSAHSYLSSISESSAPTNESDLLRTIRLSLRGSDTEFISTIQSTTFACESEPNERELTWNAHIVVLSYGGVMVKRWSFQEEGECIQWACLGELEQYMEAAPSSSHSAAHYTSSHEPPLKSHSAHSRSTFGPFTRSQMHPKPNLGRQELVPAVFVFLRSIGKIYLQNGLDYTFSLPFIVRKAWPISPHGVMIQRVLEPGEFIEAEITGEPVLPTIFSVTSPFAEAAAVGLTNGIIGGYQQQPASLKDEDENSTRPLSSIPPTEMLVWTSHRSLISSDDVVVTVDVEAHQLSIWRYVYIKPKDTPVPLITTKVQSNHKKRQSMSAVASRRSSALFVDMTGRADRLHPLSPKLRSRETSPAPDFFELKDMPPLSSLPGMAPSLSSTTTMQSLVSGASSSQRSAPIKGRRNSLTRHDLTVTMNRMVLGGRMDTDIAPIEHGRMKAAYWMEDVYSQDISMDDAASWRNISVELFDNRWDGQAMRCLMSICLPHSQTAKIFSITYGADRMMKISTLVELPAVVATSIRSTRKTIWDLLILEPSGHLKLLTHGLHELPVEVDQRPSWSFADSSAMDLDKSSDITHKTILSIQDTSLSSTTFIFEDGSRARANFELFPNDRLTDECLRLLALTLPPEVFFQLHRAFMENWIQRQLSIGGSVEFECFTAAIYRVFDLVQDEILPSSDPWLRLAFSHTHNRFREDPVMKYLSAPPNPPSSRLILCSPKPHIFLAPILYTLHTLGEYLRLSIHRYDSLMVLAPVICKIANIIRPEWADYWKRLIPDVGIPWPSQLTTVVEYLDDRIPVWPPDMSAILYGRISTPDWNAWHGAHHIVSLFQIIPSFAYGHMDPLADLHKLNEFYKCLADKEVKETQKRAENAVFQMVTTAGSDFLDSLPLGVAAPLREAARTCQLVPPGNWPLNAYKAIGRNDLAASASESHDVLFSDGYKSMKDFINSSRVRHSIGDIVSEAKAAGNGDIDSVSGVELNLEGFTDIRFGQDRRLEEVARILCSSTVASIKIVDRPELNEHDQTKEHQNQVIRVAERTLALPYGRAIFTFGSVPTVTREAYAVPKLEYTVRIQPLNITVPLEPGKIPPESLSWGEFHNGVAAGLRISPTSRGVESSWIAFNKPSELTPEHAGFLLGLGLTGHLKEMLTWHTFAYLTPKHDLTSIGVLLGLSAANIGSGNQHVTKLLAVHTPALLPTPSVDLNVSLVTQAAGLSGVGLLYLGTKNRRMAEVCLNQICRRDLVQPDISNEHREAYTYSAALAFGMVMLGMGTTIPADMALLSRLSVLIHGDANQMLRKRSRTPFDINLTSPAATIALGLMYLRTERQDIADILTIPDTVLALNRIQPSFLLIRTIARSLIMWNAIAPTTEWLIDQVPATIREAIDARSKGTKVIDDAFELAYYNILAGCCFAVGLKYAGTARQEAYIMIVRYFDLFTRLVYSNGPAFDHKIKRSAVRDGLNLISISLSMVMAGTGEITCLRRLRFAYGMYQQAAYHHGFKYGVHVATHMSLGLLFLGGGRFTLGTSDAAIACMVTAFYPRFHHTSADNKSFLQALRHLWVLAVEPRCLIARDVDTSEVVYLPVKITTREGSEIDRSQLISPTLIPDIDKLMSIRVDTPRYWPFYLDTESLPRHKEALLKSQTLYVKRRTAFLSYTEDPRGSRSLFVRSGSSAGDAATLDFPQLTDTKTHPAGNLSEFITSFSNDVLFLAFADHFSRGEGTTPDERLFNTYCHAALLDSILQDKPQTLQSHLTLYLYRTMSPRSRYFHLRLQDLRFAADFYSKIYDRRFSGRTENNLRPPLLRDTTVLGALHALDTQLDGVRMQPQFIALLQRYSCGEVIDIFTSVPSSDGAVSPEQSQLLAWYLLRNGVPVSTVLVILRSLARDAHAQCLGTPPPIGTNDAAALDVAIKEVVQLTGTKMTTALGSGWAVRSLDEIVHAWRVQE